MRSTLKSQRPWPKLLCYDFNCCSQSVILQFLLFTRNCNLYILTKFLHYQQLSVRLYFQDFQKFEDSVEENTLKEFLKIQWAHFMQSNFNVRAVPLCKKHTHAEKTHIFIISCSKTDSMAYIHRQMHYVNRLFYLKHKTHWIRICFVKIVLWSL